MLRQAKPRRWLRSRSVSPERRREGIPRLTLREREELARPWRQSSTGKKDDQKKRKRSTSVEPTETQKKRKEGKASSSTKELTTVKKKEKVVKEELQPSSSEAERPVKKPKRCHYICKGCGEKQKAKNRRWKHGRHEAACVCKDCLNKYFPEQARKYKTERLDFLLYTSDPSQEKKGVNHGDTRHYNNK